MTFNLATSEVNTNPKIWKLKDICSKIGSGATPRGGESAYLDERVEYAFVRSQNVFDFKFESSEVRFISDESAQKLKGVHLKKDDILLNITGDGITFSRCCIVDERILPAAVNQHVAIIRVNQEVCLPGYLLAFLCAPETKAYIASFNAGGSRRAITKGHIESFEIPAASLKRQEAIQNIVYSIIQKIELNRETNQTLEQMAQAIFKSWFVDFDPVKAKMNGEQPEGMDAATASLFPEKLVSETGVPEGWKLSEIGDEVTVVGGGTPSKKNDDFWIDGHIHWTSPKDLSGVKDKVLLDTASKVTEAGLKKVSSGLLPVDTVLLSSRAPVGYLALAKVPMAINQGYIAMKCEKQLPPEFVLQWCVHRMDEIKQRASGSTFAEISKKSFKPIPVVVPTEDVLAAYRKVVKPLYDAITSNARQNEQLSSLRDTLLPKLLSGEIKLEEENNLTGALT